MAINILGDNDPQLTNNKLFQILLYIGECRYLPLSLLQSVKTNLTKRAASGPVIESLSKAGFIRITGDDILSITDKALKSLEENKLLTAHLDNRFRGNYGIHQQALTGVIWSVIHQPGYHLTFYPKLTNRGARWLEPDACVIWKKPESSDYKIEFIEVENTEKPDSYLREKSAKYEEMATWVWLWDDWWRRQANKFRLPFPEIENFYFGVTCYGKEQDGTIFAWK